MLIKREVIGLVGSSGSKWGDLMCAVCQRWWGGVETKEEGRDKRDGNDGAASVEKGGGGFPGLPLSMTAVVILL